MASADLNAHVNVTIEVQPVVKKLNFMEEQHELIGKLMVFRNANHSPQNDAIRDHLVEAWVLIEAEYLEWKANNRMALR